MAPRPQVPEHISAPPEAWLLCAACGPLEAGALQRTGIELEGVEGIFCKERCYEVEEPVPFPILKRWVAGNVRLCRKIRRLEDERRRRAEAGQSRPSTHAELAGRARAALLLEDEQAFEELYAQYIQGIDACDWHPDVFLAGFCESVLGPGWEGIDALPPGKAKCGIAVAWSNACAFVASSAGASPGRGALELLPEHGADGRLVEAAVAEALRAADARTLEPLLREGYSAAVAAQALLSGRQEEAQACFETIFGRALDNRYRFACRHSLGLLLYAIIGRVFAGASRPYLQAWTGYARHAISYVFPSSREVERHDLGRFVDHLELVDSLVNRSATMAQAPSFAGGLSRLPFAMAYAALPVDVRRKLKIRELVEAVEYCIQGGMFLVGRYGASGLLQADSLGAGYRQRLEKLQEGVDKCMLPRLPAPVTERALACVRECVRKQAASAATALQLPDAQSPVLQASRTESGASLRLEEGSAPAGRAVPPVMRRLRQYACSGQVALEGATPAELTRLFVELQPQVEVVGCLAAENEPVVEAVPRPVLLLAHMGSGHCLASLRLRLLPGCAPLVAAGSGLAVPVLEGSGGEAVAVRRNMATEWRVVEATAAALEQAGLAEGGKLLHGSISLNGFTALARLLSLCRERKLETCWNKGYALQLHQAQSGLVFRRGKGAGEWLELGGGLPVDEGRVLELSSLLEGVASREGGALCLGEGEYVLLTPELEQQLELLRLARQEKGGKWGVASSALPLLEALGKRQQAAQPLPPELPLGLQAELRPYQLAGYRWLTERAELGVGALMADDMGLGKTVQMLALLLHAARKAGTAPSLVIAPVTLLGNWKEEAARFAPSLQAIIYEPKKAGCLAGLGCGSLVLASYGQLAAGLKDFAALSWNVVVLDEAQAIKNPDSRRAKAVCALRARSRFCLTGTPIENSLLDLWSQIRFLNPGLLGSRAAFLRRFRHAGEEAFSLLRQVLAPLVLRRTKAEVLAQLPPLTEHIERVDFSREERALYESLRRSALAKLGRENEGGQGGISILAELTRLRRACCHGRLALADFCGSSAKLDAMVERVEQLRAARRRVLIFSQFTDVLDLAQEALAGHGITCLRLDGSTPQRQRSALVERFQRGEADVFLISLKAGGSGLNLTAADCVMLLDPWWNPAAEAQAAGRSHRMGQGQAVTLCRFIVRDTVEERILELHRSKSELADSVLRGSAEGVSLDNLRALLD